MNTKLRHGIFSCALILASCFSPRAIAALVDLEMLVTPLIGSNQYDITIRNNSLVDLTLVSLVNVPVGDPLIDPSLTAPAGFLAFYDSNLGIVDFLEGTSVFGAGLTVTGFRFNSSFLPGPTTFTQFQAIDINGDIFNGTITLVSGPSRSVSDSSSTVILAAIALAATALSRRVLCPRRTPAGNPTPTPFHP